MACPPIRSELVRDRFDDDLRTRTRPWDLVASVYRRIAMGCSHSVHSLMAINMEVVGRTFASQQRLGVAAATKPPAPDPPGPPRGRQAEVLLDQDRHLLCHPSLPGRAIAFVVRRGLVPR